MPSKSPKSGQKADNRRQRADKRRQKTDFLSSDICHLSSIKSRNIKLVIEYDGSAFHGFQRQPDRISVQETLENALSKFIKGSAKISSASGRTDAGVHAAYQVVNFKTKSPRSLYEIRKALNAHLPHTMAVTEVEEMPEDFHARFSAKAKAYEYTIWNHPVRSIFWKGRAWHVPFKLNVAKMKQGCKALEGKRDFASFCTTDPARKERDTVRTLKKLSIKKKGSLLVVRAEADGFLYRMVRNLVGTLIDLGCGKLETGDIRKILDARTRTKAGRTAPAEGLSLVNVTY